MKTGVALFMVILLAGCAESNPTLAETAPKHDDKVREEIPPTVHSVEPTRSPFQDEQMRLLLTDCRGLTARTYLPSELTEAEPPNGWERGPAPITEVRLNLLTCGRFSLGPFERPGVSLLLEVHDNRRTPESCATGVGGEYSSSEIIHQLWINDEEIVVYLTELGLPVRFATINETQAGETITWNLESPGLPTYWLMKPLEQEPNFREGITYRRFWQDAHGGISFMDWDQSYFFNGQDPNQVISYMGAPFLYVSPVEVTHRVGNIVEEANVDAPITRFGDLLCERPI